MNVKGDIRNSRKAEIMKKEITIGGGNMLPCLHCGKMVDMSGEIHLCKRENSEWLKKQDVAIIQMPDGNLFDMKNKKILRKG